MKKNSNQPLAEETKKSKSFLAAISPRQVFGTTFCLIALFLLLAMLSNLFTGAADQSEASMGYSYLTTPQNWAGKLGAICAYKLMNNLFGIFSLLIPSFMLAGGIKLLNPRLKRIRLWLLFLHFGGIMILGSIAIQGFQAYWFENLYIDLFSFKLGGAHGQEVFRFLQENLGDIFTLFLLSIITLSYLIYLATIVYKGIAALLSRGFSLLFRQRSSTQLGTDTSEEEAPTANNGDHKVSAEQTDAQDLANDTKKEDVKKGDNTSDSSLESLTAPFRNDDREAKEITLTLTPSETEIASPAAETLVPPESQTTSPPLSTEADSLEINIEQHINEPTANSKTAEEVLSMEPFDPRRELSRYQFPPISLLEKHDANNVEIDMGEQNANKDRIITVLRNFSVEISGISATIGPTVTLYEIVPAPGVRVSKIKNLEDDIALSLSADGIRIIAPIPGKGTIGIEVPNRKPQIVSMESIINTQKFHDTQFELPLALGKTITNEVFMVDLAKMPHMLVAGATGQGKSVGLNAIIASLLYKKHPTELKLVMVDPKKVEFSMYNPLVKHFLAQVPDSDEPVITDTQKVIQTLKSLCVEMDDRYELLKAAHCKNLREYNDKFKSRRLNPELGHRFLPYIVVVIDEYGDLIMTAGKDIEYPIARIAQLARAVGMHMVIATQSPRADIITGKIKANFPARMAFRVMGLQESRIILDEKGANSLIGRGDMLIMTGGNTTRVQCAFLDTPEVEAITNFISQQQGLPYPYELPLVTEDGTEGDGSYNVGAGGDTFDEVARFVVRTQQGSTSKIQRTFSIGFNRAGRLMDQLEEAGIVGPQNGSKPREVYVQDEGQLMLILESLKAQGKKFG